VASSLDKEGECEEPGEGVELQEIPDVHEGDWIILTKVDPEVMEAQEFAGRLIRWVGMMDEEPKICVGQQINLDPGEEETALRTSKVRRILRSQDGRYKIWTRNSVYRLRLPEVLQTESSPLSWRERLKAKFRRIFKREGQS
jgi:hypothetical protein